VSTWVVVIVFMFNSLSLLPDGGIAWSVVLV